MKKIKKILIANRGEVARRIQNACHSLNIQTIAIYTATDQTAPYVTEADYAYKLTKDGSPGYLDQDNIISIAKKADVDAIHPGYGFLSENGNFAQKVINAGLTWIGPHPQAILSMGDKAIAQKIMRDTGVPVIPGVSIKTSTPKALEIAEEQATNIGFPIMLKCVHGGGGKGMRLVKTHDQFESAWKQVTIEAKKQFHSETILIEKQIEQTRHIEVQIAGDGKNYIHLYERECSVQRKHQKIIEESPCIFISHQTKQKLYDASIAAAKAINYDSIGTIEFLVTPDENFYFLEMNTRLQVEHSVTELTTDVDLVSLQIILAQEKDLPFRQNDLYQHGHAIECRLYAENPNNQFAPSAGLIANLVLPSHPFLRIDCDIENETEVTPFFDPMILKFTTHGRTRNDALNAMSAALTKTNVTGIDTNLNFLHNILLSKEFQHGAINTQSLALSPFLSNLLKNPEDSTYFTKEEITSLFEMISNNSLNQNKTETTSIVPARRLNKWKEQSWK